MDARTGACVAGGSAPSGITAASITWPAEASASAAASLGPIAGPRGERGAVPRARVTGKLSHVPVRIITKPPKNGCKAEEKYLKHEKEGRKSI